MKISPLAPQIRTNKYIYNTLQKMGTLKGREIQVSSPGSLKPPSFMFSYFSNRKRKTRFAIVFSCAPYL